MSRLRIQRTDHDEDETVWLRGMKNFRSLVPDPPPGSGWSTRDHPVQAFQWGDYTAKPGHEYPYLVTAFGDPPTAKGALGAASVRVRTEVEDDGLHGVWFNRWVAGSQAYAKRYGSYRPDGHDERDPRWCGCPAGWARPSSPSAPRRPAPAGGCAGPSTSSRGGGTAGPR